MKGDYLGEKQDHHHTHSNATNMFSKHHPPPQFPHPTFHLPNAAAALDRQTSEETPTTTLIKKESTTNPSSHDGATIEIHRRPRGRPPGSKNKPKPPIIITQESEPPMSPYILELLPNIDIIKTVEYFCNKRSIGLCILSGSGSVANVTLRQPSTTPTPSTTVTFHGRFDILSISATILPNNMKNSNIIIDSNNNVYGDFKISLAGPQGQVFGGAVVGPLASAGVIYLIAATCTNPCYQRLPLEDEGSRSGVVSSGGGGVESEGHHHSPPGSSGGGHASAEGGGMYLPSDIIWAPTARQPLPPQPPPY
ncbi:hypothetical protein Leryth_022022 [Lithospermum erythrorhizon]|nr:hypothetical protein Leryth_022022 [Lithospermum erythrorhizon]